MDNMLKKYEFAVIATDVVIFTIFENNLKVLLIKMKKNPFSGMWAAPGGLVKSDESIDKAAVRILMEKSGVKNVYLEQLYTFGEVERDPFGRVVSVAYYALIPSDGITLKTTEEYGEIKWFDMENLPKLAYDHEDILKTALQRLRSKLEYTNIVYSLLPSEFTLTELQKTYEIILDRKIDKRNFRKKVIGLKLVENIGKKMVGKANRPAQLYKFIQKKLQMVEIL
jgi:8-oxo-dGTP diphosphatase